MGFSCDETAGRGGKGLMQGFVKERRPLLYAGKRGGGMAAVYLWPAAF
ncbi:hypothetical protein HMPREF9371_2211 [Neisseria shayeganii 871]|uniref:Uncharacterized protein n=1 Tax=Neisseria shayeganii 871 TaxID=1032488 RepID=G4CKS1_9NEIS|nr:hypothetical protein HMPREF9371_2211 [Neisseria shayeganii 871]